MKEAVLSRFTPSMMAGEDLEKILVQESRQNLAEGIVERIRESAMTPTKHHILVVGPRGSGKSHLLSVVHHRVSNMPDLQDRLLVAWLPEEAWGVDSFLQLLLGIFRAMPTDADTGKQVEALYELDAARAERVAANLLKETAGSRTLLVLAENLDEIFKGLGEGGQRSLRSYIQENPYWTIVATSPSLFGDVQLRDSPFYGFFQIEHLEELSLDDAVALLKSIAELKGKTDLARFIESTAGRARVRAVRHLAGGNHRIYITLSDFLTNPTSLDNLVEAFVRALDELTLFFQARMLLLAPQQRKIIEFLAESSGDVPVKDIARRCFMSPQTASSQLAKLREMGYVTSETAGRESYHGLREPLMRLCLEAKKNRGEPIRLFVDFLRIFYSRDELDSRLALVRLADGFEREYVARALETYDERKSPVIDACLKDIERHRTFGDYQNALKAVEDLIAVRGNARDWIRQARVQFESGDNEKGQASLDKAIELDPDNAWAWFNRGVTLGQLGRLDDAIACYDKVIELDPNNAGAWFYRGVALGQLGRLDDAIASFDKAIELDPNNAGAWFYRGVTLGQLGRLDDEIACYDKVIELDPNYAGTWFNRGVTLGQLGRLDDAIACYDKAIELDPNNAGAWVNRGVTLFQSGRNDEALASFDRAIEVDGRNAGAWLVRAEALVRVNRWADGISGLERGIEFSTEMETIREADVTSPIIDTLLSSTLDANVWRERAKTLVDLYGRFDYLTLIGDGIVRSLKSLNSPMISDTARLAWVDAWREAAGDSPKLALPLRLLDIGARYLNTRDRRLMLELPIEQRSLIEDFVKPKSDD